MTGVRVPADCGQPPAGWSWRPLASLARLETGHTPSRRVPEWWGGDVPWLALPDIRELDGRVAYRTLETTNALGLANSSARLLPKDTVCLSRTASVGFVTVLGTPMATSQDFVNWVCGPDLDPWFLANALISSRDYPMACFRSDTQDDLYATGRVVRSVRAEDCCGAASHCRWAQ